MEAVKAVFRSWDNPRAIYYRRMNDIPSSWGTAVNVQTMVFGNTGNTSGTGVAFTRDPATGENRLFGEFLVNAQGEDVVAGVRTPQHIDELKDIMPDVYNQFCDVAHRLEQHYRDMQDMEFTIENGKLFMLQTRNGKRTAHAAIKIACDLVDEGMITPQEAVCMVEPKQLDSLLHPQFDQKALKAAKEIGVGPVSYTHLIGPNTIIENSQIGNGCQIHSSFIEKSKVGNGVRIGPNSHLRPNSVLADSVKIGNFVEIKNSTLGEKTSVAHLTYIGDSDFGSHINVGCGVVTVNYNGYRKFRSTVEDNAFIGCNTNLVSPVHVGKGAYIAAGSTITDDVQEEELAIARARQTNKQGDVYKRQCLRIAAVRIPIFGKGVHPFLAENCRSNRGFSCIFCPLFDLTRIPARLDGTLRRTVSGILYGLPRCV